MKTIGLIGGMSWESTQDYYRLINQGIKHSLGGLHSAKIILNSVDFHIIEKLQHQGDWPATAEILIKAALSVQAGGADFILICTNTMHKVAAEIEQAIQIPLVHIADATAEQLASDNIDTVGLLGTRFTMEQDFYKGRLEEKFNLKVITPITEDREIVHNVIYNELCLGNIENPSRTQYLRIIQELADQGVQGVILGCTEIGLLVKQQDTKIKLFDTTAIHAAKAVELAIE